MDPMKEAIENWYRENKQVGILLGYPECCINAFCDQPPELLEKIGISEKDKMRFAASHINGKYTGFIPCWIHTIQILTGEITLESLIQNRDAQFPPFPTWCNP